MAHDDPARIQDETRTTISHPGLVIGFSMSQKCTR